MIILVVLVSLLCAYLAWEYAQAQRMARMVAALPARRGLPLLGNAAMFLGSTQKILRNIENIADLALQHKAAAAAQLWLGPKLYVAVANPDDAQHILNSFLDKDVVYRFLRPWLGHGLFVAPLSLWNSHRKVLLPVFANKIVEDYLEVIADQGDVLTARLEEQAGKGEFDVLTYVTGCTLDIVFETAMGERMDVQHSPDTAYLRARRTVLEILNMRMFKVWLQPDCLFNLTPYANQQKVNIDLTHKFTDEVVKKRRSEYESKNATTDIKEPGKLRAVLDLLFGLEIAFTDEQLREHIDSITIAGNDTTALVIAYTLVLLGIHKDVQEKVLLEQKAIFGDSKRGALKKDVSQMCYLERVIKESMRLYTVVPIVARNIDKDTHLPGCQVTIPAGSGAVVGLFALHRSKTVWGEDADQFDPDRFLPERSVGRHPGAFMPFSYGPRNCIGRYFGMLIMKSLISSVVRSYAIEADEIGPLKIEMLLFPIKGHQIRITSREKL